MGLVSIIVPTFNGGSLLHTPLRSVAAQSHQDVELIIVDDGSTDGTRRMAESLARVMPIPARVVSHGRNLGLSAARNTGLAEARGEWIQFLDSDDYIAPWKISAQMHVASQAGPDVASVYSPFQTFAMTGATRSCIDLHLFPDVERVPPVTFLLHRGFVHLSATLTRRAALLGVGGFRQEAVPWEDDEIKVRMALAGHRFVKVPNADPAFFWRLYPEQQRWGGEGARYRIERVAEGFLAAVRLALQGESPDAADLPGEIFGELCDQFTSQVRLMFRHDRQKGDAYLARVLDYFPAFRPTVPALARPMAGLVGVRRFERGVAGLRAVQQSLRPGAFG